MMTLMAKLSRVFLAVVAVSAFSFSTRADSSDTIVQINGSLNLQQQFIDNPVPEFITEQFNVSYQLDETTDSLVSGSMILNDSGVFGPLSLFEFSPKVVDWNDAAGDQIQITFFEDFNPLPLPGDTGEFFLVQVSPSEMTFPGRLITVTAVPEPAPLGLLGIGLLGLLAIKTKIF
jgi:hypothetical protein